MTFSELEPLLKSGKWVAVAGAIDPLTASQARRIVGYADTDRKLLVVIESEEENLLPAEARAILVAALRDVDAVLVARSPKDCTAVASNQNVVLVSDPESERKRTSEFKNYVIQRQNA